MTRLLPLLALVLALPALAEDAPPAAKAGGKQRPPAAKKDPFDPKAMAAKEAQHVKRALGLDDEQAKKIQAIMERDEPKKLELEKRLQEHERRTHEEIRGVLNDEQKERWDMMRAHKMMMMERMNAGMGMGMGAQRGGMMGGMRGMGGPGMMGPGGPGMMGPGGPGMMGPGGPGMGQGGPGMAPGRQPAGPPPAARGDEGDADSD